MPLDHTGNPDHGLKAVAIRRETQEARSAVSGQRSPVGGRWSVVGGRSILENIFSLKIIETRHRRRYCLSAGPFRRRRRHSVRAL